MINITIIDDHKILFEELERLINSSDMARVKNIGYSVADCRRVLESELPDVLLLDVGLPDGDGCELCTELMQKHPTLKILMLTTYAEIAVITRALDGGASGYVLKNSTSEEIMEVKSYRKNLTFKLEAHNTAQLVRMAIEQKLV